MPWFWLARVRARAGGQCLCVSARERCGAAAGRAGPKGAPRQPLSVSGRCRRRCDELGGIFFSELHKKAHVVFKKRTSLGVKGRGERSREPACVGPPQPMTNYSAQITKTSRAGRPWPRTSQCCTARDVRVLWTCETRERVYDARVQRGCDACVKSNIATEKGPEILQRSVRV